MNHDDLEEYKSKVKISDVKEYDEKNEYEIISKIARDCSTISSRMAKNKNDIYIITYYFYAFIYDSIVVELSKYDPDNMDNVLYINLLVSKVLQRYYGFSYYLPPSVLEEHNKNMSKAMTR